MLQQEETRMNKHYETHLETIALMQNESFE